MKKVRITLRLGALGALFVAVCVFYLILLVNIQVTGQDYYQIIKEETTTRYVTIKASRGEIYDTNGKPLVINTKDYDVKLEYGAMPSGKAAFNDVILAVRGAVIAGGGADTLTEPVFPFEGRYPDYVRNAEFFESASNTTKFNALLARLEQDADITDEDLIGYLRVRYGLATYNKKTDTYTDQYTPEEADILLRIRFDMEYRQFSRVEPYTLAEKVSIGTLTYVKELSFAQVLIAEEPARTYLYPGYASHILGRIGKIPAAEADAYKELGYSGDAYVGIFGVEKAFESYLHGTDGLLAITEDAYGNLLSETVVTEPVAGQDIRLTIDIDLQIVLEDALADNIAIIREKGENADEPLSGEDASAGAAVAMDPNTGAVLAIGSYPTFDLTDYAANLASYSADELRPLYNRALLGTYAPGSTFKPGVAAAALAEGVITKNTIIRDTGVYTYYPDYQPRCWLYLSRGRAHGDQNVVLAIQNSCNYFFYEVGRRLGIEAMNRYCRAYGLGVSTGIELPESVGILAGPDYRAAIGDYWKPGDTLQAAIGQSDNTFTPLQLAVYNSALINGGTRYTAHLLKEVRTFPAGEVVLENTAEVADRVELGDSVVATVKSAMKDVVESGSAASIFRGYEIEVGGKTGTAQVSSERSDNAVFCGFAPYKEPSVVVSVIIEQGANGTDAAYTAKAVFDYCVNGKGYVPLAERGE